jgi:hypothetical protein
VATSKKNRKKEELIFKTKNVRVRKEGATVAASLPYLSSAQLAASSGRTGSVFHKVIQTIGKTPLTTENVLLTNETPAFFRQKNK